MAFQKLKDTGAVASSSAAKIYGLNILAQDIQVYVVFCLFISGLVLDICENFAF